MSNFEIKDTFRYKSTDVAKYIIALANDRRITINMTKVQKLLYITYSVFLRVYKKRLLNEHPQAWPYGPVFPTTRNKLLNYDLSSLSEKDIPEEALNEMKEDAELNKVINFVFANFGEWNAGQLSEWSHSSGSPWEKISNTSGFTWGNVIPDTLIYEYFCSIITLTSDAEYEGNE